MQTIELNIDGMHCGACATGINMLVSGLDGVESVYVDFKAKTGKIKFDSGKITKDKIIATINELGYKAS